MDELQKQTYDKLHEFLCDGSEGVITLNQTEAYVAMKAMEDQQRYQNPILEIPTEAIGLK